MRGRRCGSACATGLCEARVSSLVGSPSEGPPHWGTIWGMWIRAGRRLGIDFNGKVLSLSAGDGLFIPSRPALSEHSPSLGVRLVIVEDV